VGKIKAAEQIQHPMGMPTNLSSAIPLPDRSGKKSIKKETNPEKKRQHPRKKWSTFRKG